ncbi:MAG: IS30 family transposase, partial [Clostridiales bacterium]|nr:IS30 family transposase [Clostridiales bacterium]
GIVKESRLEYFADVGQRVRDGNAEKRLKRFKIFDEEGYADFIDEKISQSNKTVSVYTANILAKKAGFKGVSDRTLYNWVDLGLLKTTKSDLPLTVRRKNKRKEKEQKRFYGDSIELRPESANNREELGHFEGDSIIGAGHKGQIITLVERKTRIGFMFKFEEKRARNILYVKKALQKRFGEDFCRIFKSITFDNGGEFAYNESISGKDRKHPEKKGDIQVYYAHAYSSWERGSNENFNGIVRRYIPKKKNFCELTQNDIRRINEQINAIPRKLLNGKSAQEMFDEQVAALRKE